MRNEKFFFLRCNVKREDLYQNQQIIREQDEAYLESLRQDQEKERIKEEEMRRKEEEERRIKEEQERQEMMELVYIYFYSLYFRTEKKKESKSKTLYQKNQKKEMM